MNFNSNFKENCMGSIVNENLKRRKLSENMSENSSKSTFVEDSESNLSVTVYEDKTEDLVYYNKSSKKRLIHSPNKRSPLSSINKHNSRRDDELAAPKSKLEVSLTKRIQPRVPAPAYDHFSRLSDEILLHIFQYLPKKALTRLATVNSRFSRVIVDESLWVRMDLANKSLQPGVIDKVLRRGLIICRLAQAKIQRPIFSEDYQGHQFKLQYLDLSLASIDKSSLAQLLSACRILKKLSLEQLELDDDICREVAENTQLEVLNLAMCEGLTAKGIRMMTKKLTSIVALNLAWTNILSDSMAVFVNSISPTLLRLNISGARQSLNDSSIEILVKRCPNIVELDISDSIMLTFLTINAVSTLRHLEYLSLSRCYNIPMTSYLTLNNVKSLMYLDVFGLLTDNGFQMFEKTFKNIGVNKFIHSSVARPTVMPRRTSIWGLRTRD